MSGTPPDDLTPPGPPVEDPGPELVRSTGSPSPYAVPPPARAPFAAPPASSDNGIGWTAVGLAWVLCIPCLPPAGVVLAVIALARKRFRPRWVAVVALLVGLAGTALQVVAIASPDFWDGFQDGVDSTSEEDDDGEDDNTIQVATAKLRTGDCFDDPRLRDLDPDGTTRTAAVAVHPCRERHDYEVYATFPVRSKDFPGQAELDVLAHRCLTAFRKFVGTPYGESVFEFFYYNPTRQSWRLIGDRKVTCIIGHPKRQVQGSLDGVKR